MISKQMALTWLWSCVLSSCQQIWAKSPLLKAKQRIQENWCSESWQQILWPQSSVTSKIFCTCLVTLFFMHGCMASTRFLRTVLCAVGVLITSDLLVRMDFLHLQRPYIRSMWDTFAYIGMVLVDMFLITIHSSNVTSVYVYWVPWRHLSNYSAASKWPRMFLSMKVWVKHKMLNASFSFFVSKSLSAPPGEIKISCVW